MPTMYCALCERPVEARRQIGPVTVFLAVITLGLSLVAVPFYPRRCSICRSTAVSNANPRAGAAAMRVSPGSRVDELEQRLRVAEADLEAANVQLDRLRTERDFYRQLLGDPVARERERGSHQ